MPETKVSKHTRYTAECTATENLRSTSAHLVKAQADNRAGETDSHLQKHSHGKGIAENG